MSLRVSHSPMGHGSEENSTTIEIMYTVTSLDSDHASPVANYLVTNDFTQAEPAHGVDKQFARCKTPSAICTFLYFNKE